ncbi:unnamed protein product [Aureobasidium uvarum]|uniref:Uncharacterized protein n=1 Tax=Aureobasidium uvarum TaxID=2773716 RepID=A0A9N8KE06_9PEZI|nr:unnamed protein product [Aureobasidium uvarum]
MDRTYEQPFRGLPRELRDMIWKESLIVDNVPFRRPTEPEKPDAGLLGVHSLLSPLHSMNDTRCDPLHLRLFLTNKQMYAETAPIFYSSNEFITDIMSLNRIDRFNASIRRDVRQVRLETLPWQAILQKQTPHPRDIHLSLTRHKLDLLTIRMPFEPPATVSVDKDASIAITPSLAADLVDCMLKGFVKRLRLLYPIPTGFISPEQFWTIKILRKGKPAVTGEQGLKLDKAWRKADTRGYAEVLYNLLDVPKKKFIARFGDGSLLRIPRGNAVIVLSRVEDEPAKKETVPRPRVCIVGPNSHLKRRLPWNHGLADPRPTKLPRLELPAFLAFSESRSCKMPQRAVQERFKGKSNQIRRLVNDKGPSLAQLPREMYCWQQHPRHGA